MNGKCAAAPSLGERVEALSSLSSGAADRVGLAALIRHAGEIISGCCGFDQLTVAVLDDSGDLCTLQSFDGEGRVLGPPRKLPADLLASTTVAETGELLYEADCATSPFPEISRLTEQGLCSAVVVPVRGSHGPVGALTAARGVVGFEGLDLMSLDLAAAVLASAVEAQRADEVAQQAEIERGKATMVLGRRIDELGALARMAEAFQRLDLGHAASVVATEMASLRGIELCRVTVLEPDGSLVPVAYSSSFGDHPGRRVQPVASDAPDAIAVATDDLVLWRRPAADDSVAVEGLKRLALSSLFATPFHLEGQVAGAILAGSTGGHRLVTDEHLVVADIAGQLLAGAAEGPRDLYRMVQRLRIPAPVGRHRR